MFPAITYFRTGMHYHRPRELNGRVRNGNVCFLVGIVTGMHRSASKAAFFCVKKSKCIATLKIAPRSCNCVYLVNRTRSKQMM